MAREPLLALGKPCLQSELHVSLGDLVKKERVGAGRRGGRKKRKKKKPGKLT